MTGVTNKTDDSPNSKEDKTLDLKNMDGLHKIIDPSSAKKKASEMIQQGFCLKLWNSFKALFGFGKKDNPNVKKFLTFHLGYKPNKGIFKCTSILHRQLL